MKHLKKFNESKFQEEMDLLKDLSLDLKDEGLEITVSDSDPRFHEKDAIYLKIEDTDKIFCKKWPEDDLDWLYNKLVETLKLSPNFIANFLIHLVIHSTVY